VAKVRIAAAHRTSVLRIHSETSSPSRSFSFATGWENEGQPVPDSNFASDANKDVPQLTQR